MLSLDKNTLFSNSTVSIGLVCIL